LGESLELDRQLTLVGSNAVAEFINERTQSHVLSALAKRCALARRRPWAG
jgi:hypothetical protein